MIVFPMLAISFIMNVVAVLFIICCIALILIILIQKGRGGGLSGAFGGGMASGILGSKTGDFLTWVTIVLVGVFLSLAVVLAKFYKPSTTSVYDDVSTPAQQEPLANPEQMPPSAEDEAIPTDSTDVNSPGG